MVNHKKQRIKSLCGNTVTWANQIRMLGQNFQRLGAVIGGGLIAWLRPAVVAINNAMDGIIAAVQRVVNALGKIFGWEMIVDTTGKSLIEDTEEVADAWDDATGAAKKYAKQLLGIDELNNLTTNDKGSGSGDDGGFGGLSGGNIIKPGGIEFKKFESDIDSLFKLGEHFSDGLRKMLDGINWNEIYLKASKFGEGLANFLNGLIKPETFYSVGKTIANALNTAIQAAFSFANTANWKQWGEAIGQSINGFFKNFNFKKFAQTLNKFAKGIFDMLAKAIKTIKWGDVFKGIFDFVKNLKIETVFGAFLLMPNKLKSKIGTALKGVYTVVSNYIGKFSGLMKEGNGFLTSFVLASPKLTNAVSTIQMAFTNYKMGIAQGYSKTQSFIGAIQYLGSAMSPLAKGITSAVAGFAEFALVSNGVKNIVSETGNLTAGIAELTLGLTAAGAVFTAMFGVGGLIATGIIGLVSAVKGLYDAFKEAENARFAESIRNALTGNGGVPLDEYLNSVKDSILSMGDGFERVSEKAQALESADKNVSDVVFDIERLKLELKNCEEGTEEYAEKVEQLKNKFNDLSDAIQTKFSSALDVVLAGLSPDSPFAKYLDSIGVSVDEHKEAVVSSFTDIEAKIKEYNDVLNDPNATPEQIENARQALIELSGAMDETAIATENLRTQVATHGLDWSSYFKDGEIDTQGITDNLKSLGDAAKEVSDTFEGGMNEMVNAAKKLGDDETAQFIRDYIPGALTDMNTQSATEIKTATDLLQTDLVNNVTDIITQASSEWENMNPLEKTFVWSGDEEKYIATRVAEYKTKVVDPISKEIETTLSDLGVDGAGWGSDAMSNVFDGMFDIDKNPNWLTGQASFETKMKNGYQDVISNVLKEVDGADITKGVLKSASDVPESEYKTATDKVESNTEDAMRKSFDSHSPAKTMFPVGKDIVLGVFKGFEEVDFQGKMSEWWTANVSPWFTVDLWHTIGDGMVVGLTDKWNEFTTWFNNTGFPDFWNSVTSKFSQEAWTFTGIGDGLRASFNTAIESVKLIWNDFAKWFNTQLNFKWDSVSANGKEVVKAGSVNLGSLPTFATGGYPTQGSLFVAGETYGQSEWVGNINGRTGVVSGYEITDISRTIRDTSEAEMALMRSQNEILMGILQKEFGISKDAIGEAARSYGREYYNRTGNQAFSY